MSRNLRRSATLAAIAVAVVGTAAPALAYWSRTGSGTGSATSTTLNSPASISAAGASSTTVTVSVIAGPASGAPVTGYRVDRVSPSPASAVCYIVGNTGNCAAAASGTGSNTYSVFSYRGTQATPTWTSATGTSVSAAPTAAAATKFAFTTGPVSGAASNSATLGPITVERQTAGGVSVVAPAGGTAVTLASSSTGTAKFTATSGGSTAVTSVTIPAGSSSVSFYYADTKAGSPVITASGSLTSATQTETITAAVASKLDFVDCSLNGNAATTGSCGSQGVGSNGFVDAKLGIVDAFGNATSVAGAITATVTSNNANFVVTGSPVSIAAAATQSTATVHVKYNGTANTSATMTAHVTVGTALSDDTMTVQK